jgi:hypothetical protein
MRRKRGVGERRVAGSRKVWEWTRRGMGESQAKRLF